MRHTCGLWRREKKKKKQKKKRAQVVKTPERPSAPASPPPCGSSRRTMACVSPGTKCSLCPPELSRLFFLLMEAIGCVQHSTSAARRVINHRVKETAGAQRPPEVEKRPDKAYRDPGHPWRPGSASIGSKWKGKVRRRRKKRTDPIWFTLRQEVRYSDEHTSPPYL